MAKVFRPGALTFGLIAPLEGYPGAFPSTRAPFTDHWRVRMRHYAQVVDYTQVAMR